MISETLLAAKAALEKSTLFARWKRDNPKEYARVEGYWENGGAFPFTATAFGLHYALDAQAYHESLPQHKTISAPQAGAGALTPPTDGADVAIFPVASPASSSAPPAVLVADISLPFIPV